MKTKTYYHLILDQSGSMDDCIHPTISGYNEQLQLLRSLQERYPGQAIRVGLTQFNHEVEHTFSNQNPAHVRELTQQVYRPGGTSLRKGLFCAVAATSKGR